MPSGTSCSRIEIIYLVIHQEDKSNQVVYTDYILIRIDQGDLSKGMSSQTGCFKDSNLDC